MNERNKFIIGIGMIAAVITIWGFLTGKFTLNDILGNSKASSSPIIEQRPARIEQSTPSNTIHDRVVLKYSEPQVQGSLSISKNEAIFDTYYTQPPHWKITYINAGISFTFSGRNTFYFHALGSTIEGQSYCHINIYINNNLYSSDKFINKEWTIYSVPSSEFSEGTNEVTITLTGRSHIWFDEVWLQ